MNKIEYAKKTITDLGVKFKLLYFRGFYNYKKYPESYTSKEIKLIKENVIDDRQKKILQCNLRVFKKECASGFKSINIDELGNVFRCNTSKRAMGNLFSNNIT